MGKKRQILFLFLALTTGALLAGGGAYLLWGSPGKKDGAIIKVINRIGPLKSVIDSKYGKKTNVFLYFSDKQNQFLIAEERNLYHSDTPTGLGEAIIKALIEGSKKGLGRTIPVNTKLDAIHITDSGLTYLDLSEDIINNYPGGCQSEYLTIYSIVNSLVLNVPEIKKVKILIGDKERSTLAGHIILNVPFAANMYLVR